MVVWLALACRSAPAPEPPVARGPPAIRVVIERDEARLEVAVRAIERGERRITLAGAVHVAEPACYELLASALADAPEVLVEGLAPDPDQPPAPDDDVGAALGELGLVFQSDALQPREGWRRSDLSVVELRSALRERGIDPGPWLDDRDRSTLRGLLTDLGDPKRRSLLRLALLAGLAGDPPDDAAYWDVIVGLRDRAVVAEVLGEEGDLGVLYGADHLPDLEARLVREGFTRAGERWLPAIVVDTAALGLGPVQVRQLVDRARKEDGGLP